MRSSTSTVTKRLRSKVRAYSRRMMVNNQGLAARSSSKESWAFQARNIVSCTTSSASARSRDSQKAKRSRSGRNDWHSASKEARRSLPTLESFICESAPDLRYLSFNINALRRTKPPPPGRNREGAEQRAAAAARPADKVQL